METNYLHLEMSGINSAKIKLLDYCNHDKDWGGVSIDSCCDGECTIAVKSDRKESKTVAKWFKDMTDPGAVMGCNTSTNYPNKLNFAFTCNFSFSQAGKDYSGTDIVFAQGHTAFHNNWWVGGPEMSSAAHISAPFTHINGIYQNFKQGKLLTAKVVFCASSGDHSHMELSVIGV